MKIPTLLNTQFLGFFHSFKSEESCFAFFFNYKISEYFMRLHLLYVFGYRHAFALALCVWGGEGGGQFNFFESQPLAGLYTCAFVL